MHIIYYSPQAQVLQSFAPVAPLQYGGCLAQGDTDPDADRVHVCRDCLRSTVLLAAAAAVAAAASLQQALERVWCLPTTPTSKSLHSFNKREDDFPSRVEYDDYLEEREDISEWQAL